MAKRRIAHPFGVGLSVSGSRTLAGCGSNGNESYAERIDRKARRGPRQKAACSFAQVGHYSGER